LAKSNLFMFKQALGNVLLGKPMGHLALFAIQAPVSFLFCCLLGTGVIVIDRVFWTVVSIPSGLRGVVTTTQQTFEWFLSFGTMKFVFVGLFDLLIWLLGGNSLTFSSRWFYFCWLFFGIIKISIYMHNRFKCLSSACHWIKLCMPGLISGQDAAKLVAMIYPVCIT
jgi:hypothetical protein